jgi:Cof subfamily protein (haloacid dehalogenase superfamily)
MLPEGLPDLLPGRRVLATDLDGTLLRPDLTVGPATKAAIAQAVAVGIHVVYVTGRPPRWIRPVIRETGHAGTAICVNGAVELDLVDEQVVRRTLLDVDAAHDVALGLRREFGDGVRFAVERVALAPMTRADAAFGEGAPEEFALEAGYRPRLAPPDRSPQLPLPDLLALPDVVKVLARLDSAQTEDFLVAAGELASGRLEVTHSSSHTLLEFGPAGVTKATALADLVSRWGLTQGDVVAVGDMPNDLAMLLWAGVGLAVAEGHPQARAAADFVVPGPQVDGMAHVLHGMITAADQ